MKTVARGLAAFAVLSLVGSVITALLAIWSHGNDAGRWGATACLLVVVGLVAAMLSGFTYEAAEL